MKIKTNVFFVLVAWLAFCFPVQAQDQKWQTRAGIEVVATGTVKSHVPVELHQIKRDKGVGQNLDLSLIGPDGKSRAFELYWRESAVVDAALLKPERVELLADNRYQIDCKLPENFELTGIRVDLNNYIEAARLDFSALKGEEWVELDRNIAMMKPGLVDPLATAGISCTAAEFSRIRVVIAGLDAGFKPTALNSLLIYVRGKTTGADYFFTSKDFDFEESVFDGDKEVKVQLPGTGIFINHVEIFTEALFQGKWQLGSEIFTLGRREFSRVAAGETTGVYQPPLVINVAAANPFWQERFLLLRMQSPDFFGEVLRVKGEVRLPRLKFIADLPGLYQLHSGAGKVVTIKEFPSSSDLQATEGIFDNVETNPETIAEDLVQNYAVGGGPFNADGYTWKAGVDIAGAGFYELVLSPKVALQGDFAGIRLVKNETQVPYFWGRSEERETSLEVKHEFNTAQNISYYQIKLPPGKNLPAYLLLKTSGIFERQVLIENHVAGQVGWQTWRSLNLQNRTPGRAEFRIQLQGFPVEQKELRIQINNGNNQALNIESISAWYKTSSLFFVAPEAGEYFLYGGNPAAAAARYDLAIVQNRLLELFPARVGHLEPIEIAASLQSAVSQTSDKGGPFDEVGYTWKSEFDVPAAGLVQLGLNQAASLDESRSSLRIVKDGLQVPYFAGNTYNRHIPLEKGENYNRDKNLTLIDLKLPVSSKFIKAIEFTIPGIFNRKPVFLIKKPGKLGWKKWQEQTWQGTNADANQFRLSLSSLPAGETEIQIEINHGDNSPVSPSEITAVYETQDLFFKATAPGNYQIFGGNTKAKAPAYDIAFIRDSLLKSQPQKISMPEAVAAHSKTNVTRELEEVFSEKGIGLYLVLGLVTLVLIILIVKMFPEENNSANDSEKKSE